MLSCKRKFKHPLYKGLKGRKSRSHDGNDGYDIDGDAEHQWNDFKTRFQWADSC